MPHGTTILGLKFADGIVMAGDRRATSGNLIADAKIRKVFAADSLSAIAIAGAAGQAVEMVKLFQLDHLDRLAGGPRDRDRGRLSAANTLRIFASAIRFPDVARRSPAITMPSANFNPRIVVPCGTGNGEPSPRATGTVPGCSARSRSTKLGLRRTARPRGQLERVAHCPPFCT